ncbi:MAG: hypothetical protein QXO82_05525 [Candidatus Methanomethylicia archaeon]
MNLYVEGFKGDEKIVGNWNVKSRAYEHELGRFNESIEKLMEIIKYPIMFAFYTHPLAEEMMKNKGMGLIHHT